MKNVDLSFLKDYVADDAVKVAELPLKALAIGGSAPKALGSIKISALKPEDFEDRPEILNKYFRHNNRPLDRFHIPDISASRYEELIGDPKKLKNVKNAKMETASQYYIDKIKLASVAKDLNCSVKQLDLTDYIWDERYYVVYNFVQNMYIVDDWYRDHGEDRRMSSKEAYISCDPRTAVMDMELYDELYSFCITAIRQRKAMLFGKVDKCLGMLRNIAEYTYGFAENPTRQQMATLRKYRDYFTELLEDKAMLEFLKSNNDITVYANDERTHSDYVDTYKALIKGVVSGTDEDIRQMSDLLTGVEDPYLEELFEITAELVFADWQLDNSDEE